jgi:peptide/nickel transport system ATP-binding protein
VLGGRPVSALALEGLRVRVGSGHSAHIAVDGIDLAVAPGSILGLVGESGSGKSTLARATVGLVAPLEGRINVAGEDFAGARGRRLRRLRRHVQLVFQDPRASLDPRMTIGETIGEVASAHRRLTRTERAAEVRRLLLQVSLDPAHAAARPRELSGGQRQRVALARALAVRPDVIVADEPTAALDVSVQGSVLNLLRELRTQTGLSLVVISHDMAIVRYVSDRIAVMRSGRIVETGETETLIAAPQQAYTRLLLESVELGE